MWKWVVRDYFAAFRWEKSKEWLKNSNGWWLILYFGFLFPVCFNMWSSDKLFGVYFVMVLPIMFSAFSTAVHPMGLPKVMYLCPMEREIRREYIAKSYLFRMLVVVLLEVLVVTLLMLLGMADIVTACVIVANSIFWAIANSGLGHQWVDMLTRERLKSVTPYALGNLATGLLMLSAFSQLGLVCVICWDNPVAWWVKWIFVAVALVIQLPLAIKLLQNWDIAINRAASYEASYLGCLFEAIRKESN